MEKEKNGQRDVYGNIEKRKDIDQKYKWKFKRTGNLLFVKATDSGRERQIDRCY